MSGTLVPSGASAPPARGRHITFQVFITSPSEGEGVEGEVNISGAALAAWPYNVTEVQFSLDNGTDVDANLSDKGSGLYYWWIHWNFTGYANGTYYLSVLARDDSSEGITPRDHVNVTIGAPSGNRPPTVSATADPTSGPLPLLIAFLADGEDLDDDPLSYAWTFGDNATGSGQSVSHTFTIEGTYGVSVTARDPLGAAAVALLTVVVEPPNIDPVATLTVEPIRGQAPLAVHVQVAATDSDGSIESATLDLGEGTPQSVINGEGIDHTYTSAGLYLLRLDVVDDRGGTATTNATVVVEGSTDQPQALVSATPLGGTVPLEVHFQSDTHGGTNATVAALQWDFADGYGSSLAEPVHTFDRPGAYLVTLLVSDTLGRRSQGNVTISATSPPPPRKPAVQISAQPHSGEVPLLVTLVAQVLPFYAGQQVRSYDWDFGDGATSTSATPVHLFVATGTSVVRLAVTMTDGEVGVATRQVIVLPADRPPSGTLTLTPASGGVPLPVDFALTIDDEDLPSVVVRFDPGDGSSSSPLPSATWRQGWNHTYGRVGTYNATVALTDDHNVTTTLARKVVVRTSLDPLISVVGASATVGVAPLAVTLTATGFHPRAERPIESVLWTIDDTDHLEGSRVVVTFLTVGVHVAAATVTDDLGQSHTTTVKVTVVARAPAQAAAPLPWGSLTLLAPVVLLVVLAAQWLRPPGAPRPQTGPKEPTAPTATTQGGEEE